MKETVLLSVASVPILGIMAQWFSWRVRIPSILVLIIVGVLVGPVFGLVSPNEVFGDLMFPLVSLSVALILFEGGLSLKLADLKVTGKIVRNLITYGAVVSWLSVSVGAVLILNIEARVAVLLGAILVVTGPTVIIPLLRTIRLERNISSILRWEGIMIDPVGASLSVLVFEIILAGGSEDALNLVIAVIITTILSGILLGSLGAFVILYVFRQNWVPDFLQESVTLILVISVYTGAHMIQTESGLLAVTVMGIVLANQKLVAIRHIVAFKENLTVLLLSSLFILLAARIEISEMTRYMDWKMASFLAMVIFISRPLSVLLSTLGCDIKWNERLFLSFMAPRGIVAAAVSALFALRLEELGMPDSEALVPVTFFVIVVTVGFYSLSGKTIARVLGIQPNQKGVLIAGAHSWCIQFAKILTQFGIPVMLVDTSRENVVAAMDEGLRAFHSSILSKKILEEVEMGSIGYLLAVTPSDETNLLALIEYSNLFGQSQVFRLYPQDKRKDLFKNQPGQMLFGQGITHAYLTTRLTAGGHIKAMAMTASYTFKTFKEENPNGIPLCFINENNRLKVFTQHTKSLPKEGHILIGLC